jgi:hypothetical protein
VHRTVRRAQVAGDGAHLVFHQAGEGSEVAGAVTELGEEALDIMPPKKVPNTASYRACMPIMPLCKT